MPETVEADTSTIVMAPMPGMLKSVDVEVGQEVSYWGWGKGGEGSYTAQLLAFMSETVEADTSTIVMAPMPGMLKSMDVEVGQEVSYWGGGGTLRPLIYQHSCQRLWRLIPQL